MHYARQEAHPSGAGGGLVLCGLLQLRAADRGIRADGKAEAAPAKRDKPLTIMGKADPRALGYIILFENNVDAKGEVERLEKLLGFKHKHVYSMPTFKGFAAEMPAEAV